MPPSVLVEQPCGSQVQGAASIGEAACLVRPVVAILTGALERWRKRLQNQMLSNIEKVSPEALMQSWFTFDPKLAERFQDMFVTMAGLGSARPSDKKK
jgi:tyrosyl-tRNA synthetase